MIGSTKFHYYIFISYNNDYKDMSPLELFFAKQNNDSIKCYEFTTNKKTIELLDTFEKGLMNITIVGQNTEGFNKFVFTRKEYNYIGNKKSYLVYIILGCVGGAIIIAIILIVSIVKCIKKRKKIADLEKKIEDEFLDDEDEEKAKKKETVTPEFAQIINGTSDTPTPTKN